MAKGFFEISVVTTDEGPVLKVTDRFSVGSGAATDQNSALVRPYRKFILDSTEIGKVHYVFYRNERQYFVLGALVYTAGERIVFFPGGRARILLRAPGPIKRGARGASDPYATTFVDHFTLDKNLLTWHIKLLERGVWYSTQNTLPIDESLFLWFQWQVRSLGELELVPERMEMRIKPPNDLRNLPTILQKIALSRDRTVSVLNSPADPEPNTLWAFQFLVSRSTEHNLPSLLATRINRPPYVVVDDTRRTHAVTSIQISLEGFEGSAWIRSFKVPGVMQAPDLVMSGGGIPKRFVVPA